MWCIHETHEMFIYMYDGNRNEKKHVDAMYPWKGIMMINVYGICDKYMWTAYETYMVYGIWMIMYKEHM